MGTFGNYFFFGIMTIVASVLLVYLIKYGLRKLVLKGTIKTDFSSWSRRRKRTLSILLGFVIYLVLYNGVCVPYHNNWGSTKEERLKEWPDEDFAKDAKYIGFHAIDIDAPASEVWKWLVQVGGYRAGWYTATFSENLFGMGIYNKYEIRPEWQSMEKGQLLLYNQIGNCTVIEDVEPGKYFVQRVDPSVDYSDWGTALYASTGKTVPLTPCNLGVEKGWSTWVLYIDELPNGKCRLLSRSANDWDTSILGSFALNTFLPIAHNLMDIEMLKQIKDCAEGNASKYENTPLPEGGIH
ncbi:hypothetical protein [Ancylomarina sp. 16SWW S1-10-2]|uniref:hypothetical protein n=1 Tax=Ancylomarina sp. 16SWW S1-10-2 TaxID=2499681 RepID=UPI0012AE0587|nr:hypothetical protein [Ancylomarina sp. 16SWW S1-10-2]MRT93014.1 hypothetical protein [Ancylomarina sp. 16SWW S1-10-2]